VKKPIPFGKYYLLDRISVGGMAEVFKAKAFGVEGFERLIAVKRILPSIAEDAKIAVQLQHANIAQIFDLGKVGDSFFIALEYVSGRDVRTLFDRMRKNGQPLPIPMAAYITMKLCEGLDYAHNKKDAAGRDLNLVHRDVSPQNILISYDGEVKIIDFGIAKAAGKAGKTQAGILKGKFGYMSPEQVRGLPLDRRSDIFAVGICLWETVTGERLFIGESDFSTLEKVRNVEIAPPSTYNRRIPDDLEKIILKILSKDVEDRYQSAMDLHDDLQSWMYTSGNFFARKDLCAFMEEHFQEEIAKETQTSGGGGELARSTVPPPPKAARAGSQTGPIRPGAPPPPPRGQNAPPPPPTAAAGRSVPPPPPPGRPGAPTAPQRPTAPGKPAPGQRVAPPPPGANKRTMLGMPAVQASPPPGKAAPPPRPGGNLPPDLASGRVATPVAQGADPGIGMDDWDEDEPPTNIYSKETAAEMAQAAVASTRQQGTAPGGPPQPPQMPPQRPPSFHEMDDADPQLSRSGGGSRLKMPLIIGGVAAVVVLAIIAIVLSLSGSGSGETILELEIDPRDNLKIVIDGTRELPGTISPFKITDLSPGSHTLTIKSEGHKDKQISVSLVAETVVSKKVILDKDATGFFLETEPPGASVWIDDRPHDEKTPFTVRNLKAGTHVVRIAKGDAFRQKTIEVEVHEGEITTLPKKALDLMEVKVTFNTNPPGAKAVLTTGNERRNLGTTPATYTLDTSKDYKISYTKDDYNPMAIPVEYQAGAEIVSLDEVTLEAKAGRPAADKPPPSGKTKTPAKPRGMGKISVQTRPWSKVSIGGKFIKNTPLVNHALRAGTHTVKVENPTYNITRTFRVKIRPGQTTTLVKTLI
jgi:eukaryotic-like serine/threonine-protein kinase